MGLSAVGILLPAAIRPVVREGVVRWRHVGLRPVDVLLVSYPKSGSTWLRFLLAHALTGQEADFDSIRKTIPPVGRHRGAPLLLPSGGRVVRSHEPLQPYYGRAGQPVVYLVRDGRDVALSYLDHMRRYGRFKGDAAAFLDLFEAGQVDGYGPWHEHVLRALDFSRATRGSFLTVRYEDLRADPEAELDRVLAFLGVHARKAPLATVVAANNKDRMRAKEATSVLLTRQATDGTPFVRPDRRQGWLELVPPALRERFERTCGAALAGAGYESRLERLLRPREDR